MWHGWWIIKRMTKGQLQTGALQPCWWLPGEGTALSSAETATVACSLCKRGCVTPDPSVLTDWLSLVGVNPQTSADCFVQKEQSLFKNRNAETYKQEINSQRKDSIDIKLSFTLILFSLQVNCSGVCPENHQEKQMSRQSTYQVYSCEVCIQG